MPGERPGLVMQTVERSLNENNLYNASKIISWLDRGGDINVTSFSKRGLTLLMMACLDDDDKLVRELCSRGADVNLKAGGKTALMHCAVVGSAACGKLVLEYGGDPPSLTPPNRGVTMSSGGSEASTNSPSMKSLGAGGAKATPSTSGTVAVWAYRRSEAVRRSAMAVVAARRMVQWIAEVRRRRTMQWPMTPDENTTRRTEQ